MLYVAEDVLMRQCCLSESEARALDAVEVRGCTGTCKDAVAFAPRAGLDFAQGRVWSARQWTRSERVE